MYNDFFYLNCNSSAQFLSYSCNNEEAKSLQKKSSIVQKHKILHVKHKHIKQNDNKGIKTGFIFLIGIRL